MDDSRFEAFIKAKREKRDLAKAKDRKKAFTEYLAAKKPAEKDPPLPDKKDNLEEWRFLDE